MEESGPGLEGCLKLLKGDRDEQKLAGLLLATNFCKGDDKSSILKVYDAVGTSFLDRLLRTGMEKGNEEDRGAYLQLSITVLAAFCRVEEIASAKDMLSRVPLVLDILSNKSGSSVFEECYECLLLIAAASEDGLTTLYKSGAMTILAAHISTLPDGSPFLDLSMKLLQLMLNQLPLGIMYVEYASELAFVVVTVARQFSMLHNALKFDALRLLSVLLSSEYAAPLHDALRLRPKGDIWATYIGAGIIAILQNRVASAEKLQALVLAESMMRVLGEIWLLSPMTLPGDRESIPVDRCLVLVLESARVEVAVLLNELAYLKYEAFRNSDESVLLKQRNLATSFSLIERIIRLISNVCGAEGTSISESTLTKVMMGLTETIGLVFDFLQDAKDHGQHKGDDLLASVRIIGSYLAETPIAFKEKFRELFEYIVKVEGEAEQSPFYAVCFLLPMLCQATMEIEGCRALVSCGGHVSVVECLVKLVGPNSQMADDHSGTIFLGCDTVMNLLLKNADIQVPLDVSDFIHLLGPLTAWAESSNDLSIIMMASSICVLILDLTSEESLLKFPAFDPLTLQNLSELLVRSLEICAQGELCDDIKSELDLHEIVSEGYARWSNRFPTIKQAYERSMCLER